MDRDSRVKHRTYRLGNPARFGFLGIVSWGVASWLTGCQPASDVAGGACSTAAQCPSGEQCIAGQCLPPNNGSAGAVHQAGMGSGGNSGAVGGNGAGGQSSAGTPSTAGQSGSGTAGQAAAGGASHAGAGGAGSGTAGASSAGAGAGGRQGGAGSGGNTSAGSAGSMAGAMSLPDVVGKCKDDYLPAANNGSVTRYDFSQGTSLPACAYVITHKGAGRDGDWDTVEGISTGDGGYFGAMNTSDYNKGATCGACAEVTYNGGKKVVITIVDECPIGSNSVCVKGHIDLSRKAIRQLQPNASLEHLGNGGDGSISWRYVTCPVAGNAKIRLHPSQTPDWQPVVIENGLYPLTSVTINGMTATRTGNNSGGNAWLATGQKLPYAVRATDINGDTIQATFGGGSTLIDIGKQFMCSK